MINTNSKLDLFATTPKGLELLLVEELRSLGALDPAEKLAGVTFSGDLSLAYKACLWSRLANRILMRLAQFPATTPEELYAGVQTIAWDEHLETTGSLSVNCVCSQSVITHTLFAAQKVKDAVVDQFRAKYGTRPNVARDNPDLNINVYLHRNIATVSLDLAGESLHKRGFRLEHGAAPLKENLAAAILLRAGWNQIAKQGGMLLDPMCGSGTLLIEAALMAGDIAPGLGRQYFGFLGWKKHAAHLWEPLVNDAKQRQAQGKLPEIVGYDADPRAVKIAFSNIERAGLVGKIHVEKRDLSVCAPKQSKGLLVVNPPYGERLGEVEELQGLYASLGAQLKKSFVGWQAAVFTGNPDLGKVMGLRARKQYALFNGAIPCQLLLFDVQSEWFVDRSPESNNERNIRNAIKALSPEELEVGQMFANRIRKNVKNLKKLISSQALTSYRIYDADLPEYAVAVDIYEQYVYVQEYPAPKTVDKFKAEQRLQQILAVLPDALQIAPKNIFLKTTLQALAKSGMSNLPAFYTISEQDAKFLVHFSSDIGLPLEQRKLRTYLRETMQHKRFLNLFSRSGSLTVCAALAGALQTKSIFEDEDHVTWTKKNMALNGCLGPQHQYLYADVSQWLQYEKARYDFIVAELPGNAFELREEHPDLIRQVTRLLTVDGECLLLTRDSRFKLAPELTNEYQVTELTQQMLPPDFVRSPKIQQLWLIKTR